MYAKKQNRYLKVFGFIYLIIESICYIDKDAKKYGYKIEEFCNK
jgi:hypothetical protein